MGKSSSRKIVVSKDGPYIVSGNVPLAVQTITPNREGLSWDWKEGKRIETKGGVQSLQVRSFEEQAVLR
jgi:hypothetical protein